MIRTGVAAHSTPAPSLPRGTHQGLSRGLVVSAGYPTTTGYPSARHPISLRQNPVGQSIRSTASYARSRAAFSVFPVAQTASTRPPAARIRPVRVLFGPRVKYLHVRHGGGLLQPFDLTTALRRVGIAARRHHHGDRGGIEQPHVEVLQFAVARRLQRRQQIGPQAGSKSGTRDRRTAR